MLKFIYSEKATKFCKISTVDLSYVVPVKSTVEILQNFVVFSEYMNFNIEECCQEDWLAILLLFKPPQVGSFYTDPLVIVIAYYFFVVAKLL